MAVSAPGGKKVLLGDRGVKTLDTDLKKSLMSLARIPRLPEQCLSARHCRLSHFILTSTRSFTLFHLCFGCSSSRDWIFRW